MPKARYGWLNSCAPHSRTYLPSGTLKPQLILLASLSVRQCIVSSLNGTMSFPKPALSARPASDKAPLSLNTRTHRVNVNQSSTYAIPPSLKPRRFQLHPPTHRSKLRQLGRHVATPEPSAANDGTHRNPTHLVDCAPNRERSHHRSGCSIRIPGLSEKTNTACSHQIGHRKR